MTHSISLRAGRFAFLILFFTLGGASALEEAAPINPDESKIEDKIFQDLEKAQKLYMQGLGQFQQGNVNAAKKNIRKAFDLISSMIVEEGIGDKVQPEVQSLLNKIRTAEVDAAPGTPATPSSLDLTPEDLVKSTQPIPAMDLSRYTIRVDPNDEMVQRVIATYTGPRRDKVEAALARSGRYREMMMPILKEFRLPRELFYLLMVESEYKMGAYSRAGAAGLWQIMPATGRMLGLKVGYWLDERYDPEMATRAAAKYLRQLYDQFDDWHLALAAYNRGEHGIGRDLRFAKATEFSELSMRSALPRETEYYLPKFMACALMADFPSKYGFNPAYEKPEEYDVVEIEKPLDLKVAAECAGTNEETLRRLNPAIRAWCTPINYPNFKLRIPKGTKGKFTAALAQVKDWNPTQGFVRHKVRSGEVLGSIAKKYRTTVRAIQEANRISNVRYLRPGQVLNIQPGRGYFKN